MDRTHWIVAGIAGAASIDDAFCDALAYRCVGTDQAWPGCPTACPTWRRWSWPSRWPRSFAPWHAPAR